MTTDVQDLYLITLVAKQYYYENRTQDEISRSLGLSRTKIGRMLKQSRDLGLVTIRINLNPSELSDLEQELKRRFGLQRALIALDHDDENSQRRSVAQLVCDNLAEILTDGATVAVGMGRNLSEVTMHLGGPKGRDCLFVSSIGGSLRAGEGLNSDHIARRFAASFNGRSETLYAPAHVGAPHLRELLLADETVRQTLNRARRADVALIGIGDCSESSYLVKMGWFTTPEIAGARMKGTVADVSGYDFLDIDGNPSAPELQGRVIGLSHEDFRHIPNVIAVASERSKTLSLLASLRSGIINTLATSAGIVRAIIEIDEARPRRQG
ncbi:DNA-binding protein [Aureimonas endophytica]|uniref:DNA-binding protein n=1 Tax=Aureimonas endophytica TaxID=2027858 RepID=A0A916ZNA3_9HYPH|nr:sugar-binding transcriptional regulator [Aureimonas endophytica]GGE06030.1 DNA-binding protein [Aureimonas endophytica]